VKHTLRKKILAFVILSVLVTAALLTTLSITNMNARADQRVTAFKVFLMGRQVPAQEIDRLLAKDKTIIQAEISHLIIEYLVLSLAVTGIIAALAAILVRRWITAPLEAITNAVKNFNNDLTLRVPVGSADEVGDLAAWLNQHLQDLHRSIGMVAQVTTGLHTQAESIASAMYPQSASAAQLSGAVAEIAATMDELSASAGQIAQHSGSVLARADQTLSDSRQGAAEVASLTARINDISTDIQANLAEMAELGRKSKEINKIMAIINNIANQTKLIAFNAALEAASAGDSGKRFGVVAAEIRRLADNVVESTGEIEGRIEEILDAVDRLVLSSEKTSGRVVDGQAYARRTVAMLDQLVDRVQESAAAARQISLSTQQQQLASGRVALTIKDLEQGTLHSTAAIQKMNVVTSELAGLSGELKSLVTTFKLNPQEPG
jgi:methyl-accepting chemotaxis protein